MAHDNVTEHRTLILSGHHIPDTATARLYIMEAAENIANSKSSEQRLNVQRAMIRLRTMFHIQHCPTNRDMPQLDQLSLTSKIEKVALTGTEGAIY